jgi:hypothetical protein
MLDASFNLELKAEGRGQRHSEEEEAESGCNFLFLRVTIVQAIFVFGLME